MQARFSVKSQFHIYQITIPNHSNLLKRVIVVDRVYHANKTKKSYESKGHGDQINTSKSITNRLAFLFCFCFIFVFLLLSPFLYQFSFSFLMLSFYLFSVDLFLSISILLFDRFAQHVAGGEWTVATIPAHIVLSFYQTLPILYIISVYIFFFFVLQLILSITYQC